jgi:acid phosphatase family membrane protein YuiD
MFAMQGIGAALAGAVAQRTGAGAAMALLAAVSVAVTLVLAPGLRPPAGTRAASERAAEPVARTSD